MKTAAYLDATRKHMGELGAQFALKGDRLGELIKASAGLYEHADEDPNCECTEAWHQASCALAPVGVGERPEPAAARLCDDDGTVRGGPMHHGQDYPCTGSAHFGGVFYRCTTAIHNEKPKGWVS